MNHRASYGLVPLSGVFGASGDVGGDIPMEQAPLSEFHEHGSFDDAVESGRVLRVGVCVGTLQIRIEGGREEHRSSFLMESAVVPEFTRAVTAALDDVQQVAA